MDKPTDLDSHRGMAAQKETEARRHDAGVEADQAVLRHNRDELEKMLFSGPAANWPELGEKMRYLLGLLAATYQGQEPRYGRMIGDVIDDIERLSGLTGGRAR
jgi:hypothetical protein